MSVLLSAALVAGVVSPAYVAPASAAQNQATLPTKIVPGITQAHLVESKSLEPSGDFANHVVTVPAPDIKFTQPTHTTFDSSTAKITSQTEDSTTYTDVQGVSQTLVSPTPINVKQGNAWVPSQTSLSSSGAGYRVTTNPLSPEFAGSASDANLFRITRDGHSISFALEGASDVDVQHLVVPFTSIGADFAKYPSVFKDTDLDYQVQPGQVKESVVLSAAPTVTPVYLWKVSAGDLTLKRDSSGDVDFLNAAGDVVVEMPVPTMWDSSGNSDRADVSTGVPYMLTHLAGSEWEIAMSPSLSWLQDPARIYPVVVDPTVAAADNTHSEKADGSPNTGHALVGNPNQSGCNCYWRTTAHYNYEQLFGQQITGATFTGTRYAGGTTGVADVYVYASSANPGSTTNSYNAQECTNPNCTPLGSFQLTGVGSAGTTGDIGSLFSSWVNSRTSGNYLFMKGDEVPGAYSYELMTTSVSFTSVAEPSVTGVSAATPTNGARAADMPIMQGIATDPTGGGDALDYQFSTSPTFATIGFDSGYVGTGPYQVPAGSLAPETVYYYRINVEDNGTYGPSLPQTATNAAWSFKTNTAAPSPAQTLVVPADQSVVSSLLPLFSTPQVVDFDGDNVQYEFRVATGANGNSGAVTTSGWLTPTGSKPVTWTPPAGTLQDGVAYSVQVLTSDGYDTTVSPWVSHFSENLRIGDNGPSPTDTEGPVTVNLANGNASLSFASPTVSTVGGAMGLSFAYNSLTPANKYQGLTGSYYNALNTGQTSTTSFTFAGRIPVLTRTDANVNFNWGTAAPAPSVPQTYFMAKWTGFVTLPATGGPYTFGTNTDDGSMLTVGGTQLINQWVSPAGQQWASSTTAAAGPVPIEFDYYQGAVTASAELMVKDGSGNTYPIPASWLTTSYQSMPAAWSASAPIDGDASAYVSATVTDSAVTLVDDSGAAHTYTKSSSGGYTPPAGEEGTVALDQTGVVTFTDSDGTVYVFNQAGKISSVTTPADTLKPAAPVANADPTTGRITSLSDPLSSSGGASPTYSRQVVFVYQGDNVGSANGLTSADSDGTGTACPVTSGLGFASPPVGTLCRIVYPGHVPGTSDTTQLFYATESVVCPSVTNGQYPTSCLELAEIAEPGGADTTFGYDGNGRLTQVRNPLENDWVNVAGSGRIDTAMDETTITYDSFGRATTVTLPAPDGVTATAQPAHSYTYGSYPDATGALASPIPLGLTVGKTYVDVAGFTAPTAASADGHDGTVTFDSSLRQQSSSTASGLTTTELWNNHDDLLATLTPQGQESTSVYDSQDRETDSFGPAPASCYPTGSLTTVGSQNAGTSTCAALGTAVGHSSTSYDGGLAGLHTAWYTNSTLSGPPALYTLGIGTADGSVNQTWNGTTAPETGIPATNFSARLTGTVTFPTASNPVTYTMSLRASGASALYLNDVLVASANASTGTGTFTATSGQVVRIRVDYSQLAGASYLQLSWTPSGGSITTVPGPSLSPDYSLVTSTQTDDSAPAIAGVSSSQVPAALTSTSYGSTPWLGQVNSTTVGQNLTTSATYESGTTGYNREQSTTKPSGAGTTTTDTYYGAAATISSLPAAAGAGSSVCGLSSGTVQYGMLAFTTGPAPAAGASMALVTYYVYDALGRIKGEFSTGDTGWTCTTYDARGRVSTVSYPAYGGALARTVTNTYAVSGDPLTSSVSDTTPIAGTPSGDTITTVTDLVGQTVKSTDVWRTRTQNTYSQAGRLTQTVVTPAAGTTGAGAQTLAYTYDADGDITGETLNGTTITATSAYDSADRLTGVTYSNSTALASVAYAPTGDVSGEAWSFAAGQAGVADAEVLSQSGRVLQDTITDAGAAHPYQSTYGYDSAGRLVGANVPENVLTYSYAASGGCGANLSAGADGNRTGSTDQTNGGPATSVTYCYDNADRLTSDSIQNAPTGASPLLANALVSTGSSPNLTYDSHGDTTTLPDSSAGNETMTYDQTGRHMSTTTPSATINYTRDVGNNIVAMTTSTGGTSTTVDYSGGGGISFTLNATTNAIQEEDLSLPGGVSVSLLGATSQVWSYPDLHGDDTVAANQTGARSPGAIALYDPFGDPIDPSTGLIGTSNANNAVPVNTSTPGASFGWEGSHAKQYQHTGDIATIEMGDRQYIPLLGRFLSPDPVASGNSNDYSYPNDPVNASDLSGQKAKKKSKPKTICVGMRSPVCGVTAGGSPSASRRTLNRTKYTMAQGNRDALTFAAGAAWVSTIAGIASYFPLAAPVAKPLSILSGIVSTGIYCTHGQTAQCEIGGIATATGLGGAAAKGVLDLPVFGLSARPGETVDGIGNLIATWWNAAGLLHG